MQISHPAQMAGYTDGHRLSQRQCAIVNLLVNEAPGYVQAFSERFGVSPRSIRYDLDAIATYLQPFELRLVRHRSQGIFIQGDLQVLRGSLNPVYDAGDLTSEVAVYLMCHGHTTVMALERHFWVSRSKITKILQAAENRLREFHLEVIKKPSVGISLTGDERHLRQCLLQMIDLSHPLVLPYVEDMRQLTHTYQARTGIQFSDAGAGELTLGLCIQSLRREQHHPVFYPTARIKEALQQADMDVIMDCFAQLQMNLSIEEVIFSLELLNQTQIVYLPPDQQHRAGLSEAYRFTRAFAKLCTETMGMDFESDTSFIEGLQLHLLVAIHRLRSGRVISNPLAEQIKYKYRYLFESIKKILETISATYDLYFPDDEITYITMHVGACFELGASNSFMPTAVVVCPEGRSTSTLLRARLQTTLPELKILGSRSVSGLKPTTLEGADFIVSTVALPFTEMEVMVVNPLLEIDDIMAIKKRLLYYRNKKQLAQMVDTYGLPATRTPLLCPERIQLMSGLSHWREAITLAAQPLLYQGVIEESYIRAMIEAVEAFGAYMVFFPQVAIIHGPPKQGVRAHGLSLLVLEEAVLLGDVAGVPIRFVFILSSTDKDSELFIELAQWLMAETILERLNAVSTVADVLALLA